MIVVTTPTGNIGSRIIPILLDAGEKVRVLARFPEKIKEDVRSRVEVCQGSLDDAESVNKVVQDADSLFLVIPPTRQSDSFESHYRHIATLVANAAVAAHVKRVVAVSSTGKTWSTKVAAGPVTGCAIMDEIFEEKKIAYRAILCPGFMENVLQQVKPMKDYGSFSCPVDPSLKMPFVATPDIAAAGAKLLLDKSWSTGQDYVTVLGPQDLCFNDVVKTLSDVLGKDIRYRQVSEDAFKAQFMSIGFNEGLAQGLKDMYHEIGKGAYNKTERTRENTTPTTFAQFCKEIVKPVFLALP